jgi:hypothetical protein
MTEETAVFGGMMVWEWGFALRIVTWFTKFLGLFLVQGLKFSVEVIVRQPFGCFFGCIEKKE